MAAIGLIDDLTAAAARRSALSAGAKVEAVWSGTLDQNDAIAIRREAPDVVLFAGGTDGGDRQRVLRNARAVAGARCGAAVVIACNREVASEVAHEFEQTEHDAVVVANVLPRIDREDSGPAREAIREVFIRRVVRAKGMSTTSDFFESVLMPTPGAVLACAELLAAGSGGVSGLGSVMIVDVGGATTDVHSVMPEPPGHERIRRAGPPPAPSARTVEGDLGVRWNADAVMAQDETWLCEHLDITADHLRKSVQRRRETPSFVPDTEPERRIDRALAASCISIGISRHVGRLATHYIPGEGAEVVLDGRDLRDARLILITGGSIVRDPVGARATVQAALSRLDPAQPAPRSATILIDSSYVAAAAGLLASVDPDAALRLLRSEVPGLDSVEVG